MVVSVRDDERAGSDAGLYDSAAGSARLHVLLTCEHNISSMYHSAFRYIPHVKPYTEHRSQVGALPCGLDTGVL